MRYSIVEINSDLSVNDHLGECTTKEEAIAFARTFGYEKENYDPSITNATVRDDRARIVWQALCVSAND